MPTMFRRSNGIYYVVYTVDGKRRWKSTLTTEKHLAVKALLNSEKLLKRPANRILLSKFVEEFLASATSNYSPGTIGIYRQAFAKFLKVVGDRLLGSITPKHIDMYKTERLKALSPVSLNIELRTLRAAFYTAVRWQLLSENPFKAVRLLRIPEQSPIFLTKEDFHKLISVIPEKWFADLITVAVATGLRRGELMSLTWKDIDLQKKIIHIQSRGDFHTKTGKRRIVPMNDVVTHILEEIFQRSTTDVVFSVKGVRILDSSVTHKFKASVRKAGLDRGLHFHSLRHTFASWLVQDGVSLFEVQKLLGHSNTMVTQIYSHLQPEGLHSTVNRISLALN